MFAERIKSARKAKALSIADAASTTGLSRETVCAYESGERTPDSTDLLKLCDAYGVAPEYFFRPVTVELGGVKVGRSTFS